MEATIDSSKTRALGWAPRRSLRDDIVEFIARTKPSPASEKRVLVFTTTFHPISGPAENALATLMEQMPGMQFDIITAAHTKRRDWETLPYFKWDGLSCRIRESF